MKAVADTLAVARSNLIERASRRAKSRRPYRKAGDDELLALIRRLVDERPTYGYRRIRRLINRQRKANGIGHAPTRRGTIFIFAANFYPIEGGTRRRGQQMGNYFAPRNFWCPAVGFSCPGMSLCWCSHSSYRSVQKRMSTYDKGRRVRSRSFFR